MSSSAPHTWRQVKAKIILRYGGLKEAGKALDCTPEAIRQSLRGKCPRVAKRLAAALSGV